MVGKRLVEREGGSLTFMEMRDLIFRVGDGKKQKVHLPQGGKGHPPSPRAPPLGGNLKRKTHKKYYNLSLFRQMRRKKIVKIKC
ncbi:hypothetical protein TNIN_59441 [Trichonephila inaurata madagascariensis]|uniref:Uncharacterized protein n=1 Tax=Trichonephila inaurata madagascariensis TaxID=2747483 RepID=A0A8X6YUL7_9ARAC|nr:hypothetical protein TNIN_59441 [Trichonephila inaurata madagascariensis]